MKSHCTSTPGSIGTSMIWRAGRDAGSGNILTHSSLTGLRCSSFIQNVTLMMSSTRGAAGLDGLRRMCSEHERALLLHRGGKPAWPDRRRGSVPETMMLPMRLAFGIGDFGRSHRHRCCGAPSLLLRPVRARWF